MLQTLRLVGIRLVLKLLGWWFAFHFNEIVTVDLSNIPGLSAAGITLPNSLEFKSLLFIEALFAAK